MDNELFELCKDVYERTGWEFGEFNKYPLYTSDYLLEKLPRTLVFPWDLHCVGVDEGYSYVAEARIKDGEAGYIKKMSEADTPLKALLKLCLALSDAGESK